MMEKTALIVDETKVKTCMTLQLIRELSQKLSQEKLGKIETHKQNTDTEVLKGGGKYVEVGCWCC